MVLQDASRYDSLDLGSASAISVPLEVIEVSLGQGSLIDQFADQFVSETHWANPLRAEQVGLTEDEMRQYVRFLVFLRVLGVHEKLPKFHRTRSLYMPAFVQYILSMVGDVIIRDKGIKLTPVMEIPGSIQGQAPDPQGSEVDSSEKKVQYHYEYDAKDFPVMEVNSSEQWIDDLTKYGDLNGTVKGWLDKAFEWAAPISAKVRAFEDDLTVVRDAMPRGADGDRDVMNCALIDGYIRSIEPVAHPVATYVAAVLNSTLRKELDFKVLYRVQYDDLAFIETAIGATHEITR